jgi:hypothetical protein
MDIFAFVVNDESDEDSDYSDDRFQRRTRRCVTQRRVNYQEKSNSDTDSYLTDTQATAVASRKNTSCRSAARRLKDSDTDYQPSTDGEDRNAGESAIAVDSETHAKTAARHKRLGLDTDDSSSEAVSKKKGRLNRIVSSSGSASSDNDEEERKPSCDALKVSNDLQNGNTAGSVTESVMNGKSSRDVAVTNCNAESQNNRSFAIANLLKNTTTTSSSQPAKRLPDIGSSNQNVDPVAPIDEDSLSGIEDLVDYVTQS